MTFSKLSQLKTLTIALGANIPSHFGPPISTLIAIRPEIEKIVNHWQVSLSIRKKQNINPKKHLRFRWSPLYETNPIGGPHNQPNFINAVVVIDGEFFSSIIPSEKAIVKLLKELLELEKSFGRERNINSIKWGPRTIDIDLIAWGDLQVRTNELILPHPRLTERNFVLLPLAAALTGHKNIPRKINPQMNWPE